MTLGKPSPGREFPTLRAVAWKITRDGNRAAWSVLLTTMLLCRLLPASNSFSSVVPPAVLPCLEVNFRCGEFVSVMSKVRHTVISSSSVRKCFTLGFSSSWTTFNSSRSAPLSEKDRGEWLWVNLLSKEYPWLLFSRSFEICFPQNLFHNKLWHRTCTFKFLNIYTLSRKEQGLIYFKIPS